MNDAATFLLVGTGHWVPTGRDFKTVEVDDMLAPARQEEISQCVDLLSRFAPTRIALEILPSMDPAVNKDFAAYRAGHFALTANERHQLGFRLAEKAGLPEIHGIDWHDFERPIGWERAIDYAEAHGQQQLVRGFTDPLHETAEERAEEFERLCATSVRDMILQSCAPEAMAVSHQVYMDLARVGRGDTYVGAEVVLRWYERNMMMFNNLARLVTGPNERILLVVGAGHLTLLTHFLSGIRGFRVDDIRAYLD